MSASTDAAGSGASRRPVQAATPQEQPALIVPHRWPVLIAAMMGMTMQMLDTTIANVALPHMTASLSATQDTITWVLTSYVLAAAIALPLTGWLVDRLGVKTLVLVSVIAFTVASALCGAAQNIEQMVLFRIAQGVAGAFLSPLAQTIMLDLSTPQERPRMMTIFTQALMIGPILGPILGGFLTDNFDWRWVFYVNVPVGAACVALVVMFMPATPARPRPFDLLGWALIAICVAALQLMLDRGAQADWFESGEIIAWLVISVCGAWMAVVHIATARHPLFPRAMFFDANLAASLVLTGFVGLVLMSTTALLPTLVQNIYGYSPTDAGLLLTPRGVGMLASTTLFGKYIMRTDPRYLLMAGFATMGSSLLMMSGWAPDMPVWPIVLAGLVQGFGMSLSMVPLNLIAFASLPGQFRTDATSAMNLLRYLGSSVGIAICTVSLTRSVQVNHAEIGQRLDPGALPFPVDETAAYGSVNETALRIIDALVNKQATMIGYSNDFLAMGLASFIFVPLFLLMKKPQMAWQSSSPPADAGH